MRVKSLEFLLECGSTVLMHFYLPNYLPNFLNKPPPEYCVGPPTQQTPQEPQYPQWPLVSVVLLN